MESIPATVASTSTGVGGAGGEVKLKSKRRLELRKDNLIAWNRGGPQGKF